MSFGSRSCYMMSNSTRNLGVYRGSSHGPTASLLYSLDTLALQNSIVGYREKGYPKQKPKNGSDPKQKLARQTGSQLRSPIRPRPPRRGRFTRGPSPRPQKKYRFSDSPEAPSPLASGDPPPKASADPFSRHRARLGHRSSVSREAGKAALRCLFLLPSL